MVLASDHGARTLHGGFNINEWLIQRGWLVLRDQEKSSEGPQPLSRASVDWSRTRAWSEGGYYGRVFFNRHGREPRGIVDDTEFAKLRVELEQDLLGLRGPKGQVWNNKVYRPEQLYRKLMGLPPDLLFFCDNLNWRVNAKVGSDELYVSGSDTGADACNHDWDGVFVLAGADVPPLGELSARVIYDIAPTISTCLGVAPPPDILGESILG